MKKETKNDTGEIRMKEARNGVMSRKVIAETRTRPLCFTKLTNMIFAASLMASVPELKDGMNVVGKNMFSVMPAAIALLATQCRDDVTNDKDVEPTLPFTTEYYSDISFVGGYKNIKAAVHADGMITFLADQVARYLIINKSNVAVPTDATRIVIKLFSKTFSCQIQLEDHHGHKLSPQYDEEGEYIIFDLPEEYIGGTKKMPQLQLIFNGWLNAEDKIYVYFANDDELE